MVYQVLLRGVVSSAAEASAAAAYFTLKSGALSAFICHRKEPQRDEGYIWAISATSVCCIIFAHVATRIAALLTQHDLGLTHPIPIKLTVLMSAL